VLGHVLILMDRVHSHRTATIRTSGGTNIMQLKAGMRLSSAVCDTQAIVVRAPKDDVDLRCGGAPLLAPGESASGATLNPDHSSGSAMGKRYADEELGLEVLITKAGAGSLSIGDTPMLLKDAKPLPSSD
jgi:hypothetical protein